MVGKVPVLEARAVILVFSVGFEQNWASVARTSAWRLLLATVSKLVNANSRVQAFPSKSAMREGTGGFEESKAFSRNKR